MSQISASDNSANLIQPPGTQSRRAFLQRSATIAVMGTTAAVLLSTPGRVRADEDATPAIAGGYAGQSTTFKQIKQHENAHVDFLLNALGKDARPMPTFKGLRQKNITDFVSVSQALENTGVGAYLGAAPAIKNRDYLAAAGSIALIEARHAGYINYIVGDPITGSVLDLSKDNDFDTPLTVEQVVAGASMFIENLNGGPPVSYSTTPSAANDIAILNFALALEFLEAEFYNINVPKFF